MASAPTSLASIPFDLQLLNALSLFPGLFNPQATTQSQALGGARLAGDAAKLGGSVLGEPALANVGQGLGTAAGLAGAGWGIADTVGNPNLSSAQKAGHSNAIAGEAALSFVPYAGIGVLAKHINAMLERSRSPQVSGVGKGLGYAARPVEGLLNVTSGDLSPRAAGNRMVAQARDTPGLGRLMSPVLDAFGIGTKPTTGTSYRKDLSHIYDQVPGLKGTDMSRYTMDPNAYAAFDPKARARAELLGGFYGSYSPSFNKNPDAYTTQAASTLLNRFGKDVPDAFSGMSREQIERGLAARKLPDPLMNRFASDLATLGI